VSGAWIAGNVRGRQLLARRLGVEGARDLASAPSLAAALELLQGSYYAAPELPEHDLEAAQRAVAERTLLWLRVLSGWLPRQALEQLRALAAWFELVDIESRLAFLNGAELRRPFDTGVLGTAWRAIAPTQTVGELREALAASAWGDPGSVDPSDVHLALRLAWGRRVIASAPEAAGWAAGALALVLARETGHGLDPRMPSLPPELGDAWSSAAGLGPLRASLPPSAAWALDGVETTTDLWRAEAAWWNAVEADADALVRGPLEGRGIATGVVALLALDAARVTAALGVAALGAPSTAQEALDALL
jgi:hypothetical protein